MAIQPLQKDLAIIQSLGDDPKISNGLTTEQFKKKFDEAGEAIKEYLNTVIVPVLNAMNSGAVIMSDTKPDAAPAFWIDNSGDYTQLFYIDELGDLHTLAPKTSLAAVAGSAEALQGKEPRKLRFTNVSLPAAAFVPDSTCEDYPFRASVVLEGVTAGMVPEVCFRLTEAASGIYASVAESYDGGLYLYASEAPDSDIEIPTIILWRD